MKQKVVIKVQMSCGKCRKEAMKIAATANGVISVAVQGKDKDEIVVVGIDVDSAGLCTALRKKVKYAILLSVEEVKDPKPEEKKAEEKKPEEKKTEEKKPEEKKAEEKKPEQKQEKKQEDDQKDKKDGKKDESKPPPPQPGISVVHHHPPHHAYPPYPPPPHYCPPGPPHPQYYVYTPDENPPCVIM